MNSKPPKTLAKPYKYPQVQRKKIAKKRGEEKNKRKDKKKKREISIRNTSVEVQETKQNISQLCKFIRGKRLQKKTKREQLFYVGHLWLAFDVFFYLLLFYIYVYKHRKKV